MRCARAAAFVSAAMTMSCGHVVEDKPHWSCEKREEVSFCECTLPDSGGTLDASSVHTCDPYPCCFASTDRCTCYGYSALITSCGLIQVSDAVPVDRCPPP
jgi:hypothetical protein